MDTTNVNQDDLFMARMTLDEVQEEGGILSSQQIAEGGIVMQNTDMGINDTLIAELSQEATVVLDTEEIVDTTPEEANGETAEANAQQTDGEDEQPDEHGLVYVTRTFTVNPQEYESDNYRPINQGATDEADQKPNETIEEAKAVEITETAEEKATADEKIVLDYATYIDGSSFLCFDEQSDIDYSKIAMDGGNKKPPTRANCDTTFNQCRAKNPLFCRYHGPKLLEADIKAAIRRQLRDYKLSNDGKAPFTIEVTKAKKASPNTFTVTVGCTPKQKKHVEMILDRFLHDHKGISTTDKLKEGDKDSYMQEFEMDILKADKPPKRGNIIEESAAEERDKAVEKGKVMPVVREVGEEETAEGEGATEEVAETREAEADTVSSPEEPVATAPQIKKPSPYSFEAYGDMPNEDPETNEYEIGGSGDVMGSELLQYARRNGGLLKMPKNWGKYSADLARWQKASKTGGMYHGKPATKLNRPTMEKYGIVDPMADYLSDLLDGGLRQNDRGTFIALFGRSPKEGSNDAPFDNAPLEIQALAQQKGAEAVVDAFLEAREKYNDWVIKAKEAAKKKREKKKSATPKVEDFISFDEQEMRSQADDEYNNAYAEVERYEQGSPTIQNFSQEQMKGLKEGDVIRFDHSESSWVVKGYDVDTDTLSVIPADVEDNPLYEEWEKESEKKEFQITKDGIQEVIKESEETNESENERGTNEVGTGNAEGEEAGRDQGGESGEVRETPIERAEKTADIVISSGVASQEEQEVAESIKEAAKKAKQSKKVGEELKAHLEEKRGNGGAGEALAVASVVGAMEKAKSEASEQEKKIKEEENRLKQLQEESNREAENKVKGIAAAKVESALQQMAKQIFTTADSKSGSIDKEAEKVVSDLGEYAKSKGYEGEMGDGVGELVEEIKERNGRLQSMMEAFSKAVEQKGDAFHEEDVSHLAEVIRRDAGRLGDRFRVLQGLAFYEKKRIDDAEKVAAEKKTLEEKINGVKREEKSESEGSVRAEKSTEGSVESQARIEEIYKDWVEEEVPEWVNKLSAEEQMEYIGKLEKAMTTDIEEDGSAFDALLEYEERMEQEVANRKESKGEEVKPKKEEPESGTDTKKSEEEARKEQIAAARRLGMDAYKSDEELKKMLNMAKRHLTDPRQVQRAKDIEVILADREAKKDLPKRFVEDTAVDSDSEAKESLKQMMIEGLEG